MIDSIVILSYAFFVSTLIILFCYYYCFVSLMSQAIVFSTYKLVAMNILSSLYNI